MNNTLTIIHMLRDKGIATVRAPAGIRFMGAANVNQREREMMKRLTQSELDAALRLQR